MANKTGLIVAGVAVIAVAAGAYYFTQMKPSTGGGMTTTAATKAPAAPVDFAEDATPIGVNLAPVGQALGYGAQRLNFPQRKEIMFTNEKSLTLYTRNDDQPSKSMCNADCAKTFIPATPLPAAKPVAHWTIINRDDGTKQWALRGKPLYTYVKDEKIGDIGGVGGPDKGNFSQYGAAAYKIGTPPEGSKVAYFRANDLPVVDVKPPNGIKIDEIPDGNAIGLLDEREMTLYAFSGDVDNDQISCGPGGPGSCVMEFIPFAAPQMAHPQGDWGVVQRKDGIEQWTYKGQALYLFDGDRVIGDVKGMNVDPRYRLAAIQKFTVPASLTIQDNPGRGKIIATADGHTLYRRDVFGFIPNAHQYLHGIPYRHAVGKALSVIGCDDQCLKTFHPYLAPADAQPQGYWNIIVRPDGARQWTYKDYGLYTYDGDKLAGEMTADEIYDLTVSEDPNKVNDIGVPANGPAALYWTYAPL